MYTLYRDDNLFFKRFTEFLQDHVDEYSKRNTLGRSFMVDMSPGYLPRPPKDYIAAVANSGCESRGTLKIEDTHEDGYHEIYMDSSSTNLTGSSVGSYVEFPEVVNSMDLSLHSSLDYGDVQSHTQQHSLNTAVFTSGDGSYLDNSVSAHDIVLEGISQVELQVEDTELKSEFPEHFDVTPHNTI